MTARNIFSKTILFATLCILSIYANAQFENATVSKLKSDAVNNFESGNYSTALELYKNLLARYPKDGNYSYYCGLSLLNMNREIPRAINFLEFASTNANIPPKVFYFLGDAYTRNYQFKEAGKAYKQFANVAAKEDEKDLMPERLAEMSSNAISLTASYNQVDILASSLFNFSDGGYIAKFNSPGGSLSIKPVVLSPTSRGIKDIANLMFIPRNANKGDLIFFAGIGKNKKHGTDIFMVQAINDHKYSEPVAVDALNTEYDEILPYYDPIGKDLIFASKGNNSMGGFDLFKSHYDAGRNIWTPPVNLGFPVNSPFNEFIMVPGSDMGTIMLITDRQGLDSMVTAYLLRIHEPRVALTTANPLELKKIGNFGGIEAIPNMVDMNFEETQTNAVTQSLSGTIIGGTSETLKPVGQEMNMPEDYNRLLNLALNYQYKADSLAKLAREGRIYVKTVTIPDERWNIQKNIISWEKESSKTQQKADEYYLMVKQLENAKPVAKAVPAAIIEDTVINDIKVFRYKQETPDITANKIIKQPLTVNQEDPNLPFTSGELTPSPKSGPEIKSSNQFSLLGKSPYSASNPFPADTSIPKGAYYKIQLAVKSQEPVWDVFGGISPVTFEPVEGKAMKKYFAGKFINYEKAKSALEEVRRNGFPEAFIVSWYDGQKLSLNKVIEFEKK